METKPVPIPILIRNGFWTGAGQGLFWLIVVISLSLISDVLDKKEATTQTQECKTCS